MHLLIVDDDVLLLEFLQDALCDPGYQLSTARNGEEALQRIQQQPPDLLLTDLVMPEKDGITLIAAVRRFLPALYIVAMSGRSRNDLDIDTLELVRMLGADAVLHKPFTLDELHQVLRGGSQRH